MANIHKPFEKAFMDTMKLFMAIPNRINPTARELQIHRKLIYRTYL